MASGYIEMVLNYLTDTRGGGNVKDDGLKWVFSANDHPQVTTSSRCLRKVTSWEINELVHKSGVLVQIWGTHTTLYKLMGVVTADPHIPLLMAVS